MLYLDHAATAPLRPEARDAMAPFLEDAFGNPSGLHEISRRAKNAMEEARERATELLGASHPLEIVFTGGGTESDNLALQGPALAGGRRGGVVTTAVEHDAVLATARFLGELGCPVTIVDVDEWGVVDPQAVSAAVEPNTAVVSVMAANNETGALQPVWKTAEAVRGTNPGVAVHTDAAQAFISEEVTVAETGADLITLAAHKFGGPKGVGLLYVRRNMELEPVLHGGGQELGRRSGTHNVAGIVAMVAAMEASVADRTGFRVRVGEARERFEEALRGAFTDLVINARYDARLVQHSHLRIPGVEAESLLVLLDRAGVAAAAGSACHSGAVQISHVLEAMGLSDEAARQSVRFSFGWTTRPEDGDVAAAAVIEAAGRLR